MMDLCAGAHVLNGYGGPSALLRLRPLTDESVQMLQELYPDVPGPSLLRPRDMPLTRHALGVALDSIKVRREFASLLTHFTRFSLAKRVFQTAGPLERDVRLPASESPSRV
jgi:hypothetical protein